MDRLELKAPERRTVNNILDEFEDDFASLSLDEGLHRATVLAHELPVRVRLALNAFRLEKMSGLLCISGHDIDQARIGPTPAHWREHTGSPTARREELLLLLYGSLLGDPFGWATQQNGRLVHDVIPIEGHEYGQLGTSSESLLTWHTEDAFHPMRGDFLSFACLRNPDAAATTVGFVETLDLPEGVREILFENRFGIRPDESHFPKNNYELDQEAFESIEKQQQNPELVAVLFGDPNQPYIRADPYFMCVAEGDYEAEAALDVLNKAMADQMFELRLESGDFCFLDNFRVVHGRKPFKARHDGTDRWLKRINVTGDLRKSRVARLSPSSRSVH
jgi:Fe(II)/alpha-ketoglutarate-dependent arginine beta-hydroxylase